MPTGKADKDDLKSSKLFDVSHVTAVVTGGGSGIGLMITQALVANGAKVYSVDRREGALNTVIHLYNVGPGEIIPLLGDISKKSEAKRLAGEVANREPNGIQLLVNNAGITCDHATRFDSAGEPDMSDPLSISEHFMKSGSEDWVETFETNVVGGFFMSMAFLPLLAKGHDPQPGYTSSIINTCSNSAFLKHSTHGHIAYAASKAAFTHLSRMLAYTYAQTKVRVNTIAPGIFPTEMTTGSSGDDQKSTLDLEMPNVAGRPGYDADIAATILLLAGRGGGFYYNQILHPDGGELLIQPSII